MRQKKQHLLHFIIWLFIGLVCTVSLSAAHLTHAGLFDDFYNVGKVRDYPRWDMAITIPEEGYAGGLPIGENDEKWKYMVLTVEDSTADEIAVSFEFYKKGADQPYAVKETSLSDGRNVIKIKKKKFGAIVMRISGQAGESFTIARFQLRKQRPIPQLREKMGKRCLFFGGLYVLVSGILIFLYKKKKWHFNWYLPIDILQKIYTFAGDELTWISERLSGISKKILRCLIFLFLLFFFHAKSVSLLSGFEMFKTFQCTVLCSALLFAMAILCLERRNIRQRWHTTLAGAWVWLAVLMMISDVFVNKAEMFNGLVLAGVFGFLIYAWNTMRNKMMLVRDVLCAVHIYFVFLALFSFVFRSGAEISGRYYGAYKNPVTFSLYCSLIAVLSLAEISEYISGRKRSPVILFYVFEFLLSSFFVWKSQSRTALLAIVAILILVLSRHTVIVIRHRGMAAKTLIAFGLMIALAVPVFRGSDALLAGLSARYGTEVCFPGETVDMFLSKDNTVMVASAGTDRLPETADAPTSEQETGGTTGLLQEFENSRVWLKLKDSDMDDFSSGRTLLWKLYFRKINLFGHYYLEKYEGGKMWAHSAVAQVPYQFGVFAIIPYVLMFVLSVWKSLRYMFTNLQRTRYAVVPAAIVCVYGMFSLWDMVEHLYSFFPWVVFYLIIGLFFDDHADARSRKKQYVRNRHQLDGAGCSG